MNPADDHFVAPHGFKSKQFSDYTEADRAYWLELLKRSIRASDKTRVWNPNITGYTNTDAPAFRKTILRFNEETGASLPYRIKDLKVKFGIIKKKSDSPQPEIIEAAVEEEDAGPGASDGHVEVQVDGGAVEEGAEQTPEPDIMEDMPSLRGSNTPSGSQAGAASADEAPTPVSESDSPMRQPDFAQADSTGITSVSEPESSVMETIQEEHEGEHGAVVGTIEMDTERKKEIPKVDHEHLRFNEHEPAAVAEVAREELKEAIIEDKLAAEVGLRSEEQEKDATLKINALASAVEDLNEAAHHQPKERTDEELRAIVAGGVGDKKETEEKKDDHPLAGKTLGLVILPESLGIDVDALKKMMKGYQFEPSDPFKRAMAAAEAAQVHAEDVGLSNAALRSLAIGHGKPAIVPGAAKHRVKNVRARRKLVFDTPAQKARHSYF